MAHTIGTTVIAEGIETDEQLALIRQGGIDFYQGYLFSKPVSFEDAFHILEQEEQSKINKQH